MEFLIYLRILQKHSRVIMAGALLGISLAALVNYYWPVRYQATVNVYVQRAPETPVSGEYTYDGYYAGQAAEAYTDTVVGFLRSLDIVKRAVEISGLTVPDEGISRYQQKINVVKVAPQLIELRVKLPERELAVKLASALAQATRERAQLLNQETQNLMIIDLVNPEPLVQELKASILLNLLVGFFAGLFISIAGVFVWEYLSADRLKDQGET